MSTVLSAAALLRQSPAPVSAGLLSGEGIIMGLSEAPWQARIADEDYRKLALLIAAREGICLGSGVREQITRRVWQQMATLHVTSFAEYLRLMEGDFRSDMILDLCSILEFARFERRSVGQQKRFVTEWA